MNIYKIKKQLYLGVTLLFICLALGGCGANSPPSTTGKATLTETTALQVPSTTPDSGIIAGTPYYDLYTKDDVTYLHWTAEVPQGGRWSGIFYHLDFASVADLKRAILSGNFSKSEWEIITCFENVKSTGDVLICDLDKLCEPLYNGKLPEYSVEWYGKGYKCHFSIDRLSGTFSSMTEEEYNSKRTKQVDFSVIEKTYDPIKNADVFVGENRKEVQYELQTDGTTLQVFEKYYDDSSIPRYITVYGKSNDICFCYSIDSTEVTPDMLRALSVKPLQQ